MSIQWRQAPQSTFICVFPFREDGACPSFAGVRDSMLQPHPCCAPSGSCPSPPPTRLGNQDENGNNNLRRRDGDLNPARACKKARSGTARPHAYWAFAAMPGTALIVVSGRASARLSSE